MKLKSAGYKIGFIGKYGIRKGEDYHAKQYDYQKYVRLLVDAAQRERLFALSIDSDETTNFADSSNYNKLKGSLIAETEELKSAI